MKDVAERSGYALRTVKNVVAGKSSVGGPVREAVLKAMEELNYKQNSLASTLAKNKAYLIAVILLDGDNAYQKELEQGILRYAENYEDFGLEIELHRTKPTAQAQIRLLEEFYERDDVDGIILQPAHETDVNPQIDLLVYGDKPVLTVGTDAASSKRICFVGSDHCRSGRIASQLMANYIGRRGNVLAVCREGGRLRLEGFRQQMQERYPQVTVLTHMLTGDPEQEAACLETRIREEQVLGVFDCDDCLQQLGALLRSRQRQDVVLIGNNPTEETLDLMREGYIDVMISQEPDHTGYTALDVLFRYVSRSELPPKRVYTKLTIVTSECLP